MKRIVVLFLVLSLLLVGCGKKKQNATETPTTEGSAQNSTESTNTENTLPTGDYRHPLTGAPLSEPWSGQAVAVMVNNLKAAMPQKGISYADILYEIEVEGDITRCLAVFTDLTDAGIIGPIRSVRTYFNSVAASYDAPVIHCGGSPGLALAGRYGATDDVVANWEHIDADTSHFFRDLDRYNNGYSWEHVLFTSGTLLQKALKTYKYDTPTDKSFGLNFEEDVALSGDDATEITIKFKSGKKTIVNYNAAAKHYTLNMHGMEHIDGNTDKAVTFKNVIVLYTNQWYHTDGTHKFYDTIGSGEGYAAINGKIVPIIWSREDVNSPYIYKMMDGTDLALEVGTSYIAVVGIKNPIAYQ